MFNARCLCGRARGFRGDSGFDFPVRIFEAAIGCRAVVGVWSPKSILERGRVTVVLATIACPFSEVSMPRSYSRAAHMSMPDACPRMLSRFSRVSDLSASGHRDGRVTGRASAFGPAREEARGRRDHYKCNMDECQCRVDFYRAACRGTSAMGKSTSARSLRDTRIMIQTSRQQFSVAGHR